MNNYPYLLRNMARRPVEVHRPDGSVEVLPHGTDIWVERPDPALDHLERLGVLSRHDAPPLPNPKPKPKPKPKAQQKSRRADKRAAPAARETADKAAVAKAKLDNPEPVTPTPSKPKAPSRSSRTTRPGAHEPGGSQ